MKNCVVLHHLATLFNNTNAVSNPQQGDILCTVYSGKQLRILPNYKSYVRNNIDKILPKFCNVFLIERFTLSLDPVLIVLLKLTISRQKSGGPGPCSPPGFATYAVFFEGTKRFLGSLNTSSRSPTLKLEGFAFFYSFYLFCETFFREWSWYYCLWCETPPWMLVLAGVVIRYIDFQ